MDCKYVKERLIDYIDGDLDNDEESLIKEHLNTCAECKKEFEELKSTIDYLVDKSNKINTEKDIKLDTRINKKSFRRVTRTGLIAVVLSLIFVVTAFATDMFSFIEDWKKYSQIPINAWEQLIENGVGQKLDISAIDKGIKVTAEGVIADEINTIILLKIEDLKGNIRFTPGWDYLKEPRSFVLSGDIPNEEGIPEDIPPFASFSPLYSEEENVIKLMVWTNPLDKEEGNIQIHINKLVSMINKDEESIAEVNGNWNLDIPVTLVKSKTYRVNETINLEGNELLIKEIVIAPTMTNIEYRIQTFNKEKGYEVDGITFLIKSGSKIFGKSELSGGNLVNYDGGVIYGNYSIQSLYLEDPKDIELIVNTYSYKNKGYSLYNIDWDNLPQTIDYKGNKITIESIEYNDDNTKIIIKEDDSRKREYISSNISLRIDERKYVEDNGHNYPYTHSNYFHGTRVEYEIRDAKGKKVNLDRKPWSDEYYHFVFKQELTLSYNEFRNRQMNEEKFDKYLKPGTLYIEGQNYKKFPNIKTNIKLK